MPIIKIIYDLFFFDRKLIANGYFEKYQLNGSYIVNKPNENVNNFIRYQIYRIC